MAATICRCSGQDSAHLPQLTDLGSFKTCDHPDQHLEPASARSHEASEACEPFFKLLVLCSPHSRQALQTLVKLGI